jgi:hypothetical protein
MNQLLKLLAGSAMLVSSAVYLDADARPRGGRYKICPDGTKVPGETPIADNFDVSTWLSPAKGRTSAPIRSARSASPASAGICEGRPDRLSGTARRLAPSPVLRQHRHQRELDLSSLRTTGGSTCTRSATKSPQRTAYWMPAMLDGAGNAVKPDWINTYYKQLPARSGMRDHARSAVTSATASQCRTACASSSATTWRRGSAGRPTQQPRLLGDGLRLHGSCDRQHQPHRRQAQPRRDRRDGPLPGRRVASGGGGLPAMLGRQEPRQRQPPRHIVYAAAVAVPGHSPVQGSGSRGFSAFFTDRRQFRSPASGCRPTT